MQDFKLKCNFKKCRKILTKNACVTSCSHVFCEDHDSGDSKCAVCSTIFVQPLDFLRIDLNSSELYKTMILAGQRPETILDIATRATLFWLYQVNLEQTFLQTVNKQAEDRTQTLINYCEGQSTRHKTEMQKLQYKINSLEREIDDLKKKNEEIVQQLTDKSRLVTKLQTQCTTLKQKNVTVDWDNRPTRRSQDFTNELPRRFPPNHPFYSEVPTYRTQPNEPKEFAMNQPFPDTTKKSFKLF